MQMKLIVRSDLVFLRVQLRLVICLLEVFIIFLALSLPMETIICLQEEPLVIMLILGLDMLELLKINLLSSLIFLFESFGNFSLILRILLIFFEEICI